MDFFSKILNEFEFSRPVHLTAEGGDSGRGALKSPPKAVIHGPKADVHACRSLFTSPPKAAIHGPIDLSRS